MRVYGYGFPRMSALRLSNKYPKGISMWALVTKNGATKPLSHRFAALWGTHLGPMRINWTVSLGSLVNTGKRQEEELQRSELTPCISRSPCLRTSSSRWEPGGAVIRPPTLKALRIALICSQGLLPPPPRAVDRLQRSAERPPH